MNKFVNRLKNLDAYPKVNDDFYSRTLAGGLITLVSSLFILFLFFSEFKLYLHTVTETKLLVDTSRGEKLKINFDVTFPAIRCSLLSLDATDISGEKHYDIKHDIIKRRINAHGDVIEVRQEGIGAPTIENPLQRHGGRLDKNEKYCGSCFGAESSDDECCNSCEEVREAYRRKGWSMTNEDLIDQCKREGFVQKVKDEEGEGCSIHGSLEVNKVAGNFHFAAGKSFHQSHILVEELLAFQTASYNLSHKINRLAFGDYFPGAVNPLDRAASREGQKTRSVGHYLRVQRTHETSNGMYLYFIKVVPTIYTDIRGRTIRSNQYSVTEHFRSRDEGRLEVPGLYFVYDFSAIKITYKEEHIPFLHFITNICAIIGGIFTVAGIVDSFVYHGKKAMNKKVK